MEVYQNQIADIFNLFATKVGFNDKACVLSFPNRVKVDLRTKHPIIDAKKLPELNLQAFLVHKDDYEGAILRVDNQLLRFHDGVLITHDEDVRSRAYQEYPVKIILRDLITNIANDEISMLIGGNRRSKWLLSFFEKVTSFEDFKKKLPAGNEYTILLDSVGGDFISEVSYNELHRNSSNVNMALAISASNGKIYIYHCDQSLKNVNDIFKSFLTRQLEVNSKAYHYYITDFRMMLVSDSLATVLDSDKLSTHQYPQQITLSKTADTLIVTRANGVVTNFPLDYNKDNHRLRIQGLNKFCMTYEDGVFMETHILKALGLCAETVSLSCFPEYVEIRSIVEPDELKALRNFY